MYQCLPVALVNSTLQVALVDPLNVSRIDELGFVVKKDIQLVVADPAQVQKAIEKFYPDATKRKRLRHPQGAGRRTRRSPRKSARSPVDRRRGA